METKKIIWGVVLYLFISIFFFGAIAQAVEVRTGDYTFVSKDQVLEDDFITAADSIDIDGIVSGDVIAAGRKINIPGNVSGDVIAAGQIINISGLVRDDIRIAGADVTIGGTVMSDVIVFAGNVDFRKESSVEGDIIVYGGIAKINGKVKKKVRGEVGNLEIGGEIEGNVDVSCENLTLSEGSIIAGDLNYTSAKEAQIQGKVKGQTTHKTPQQVRKKADLRGIIIGKIISLASLIIIGLILMYLFPKKSTQVVNVLQKKSLLSLGLGFVLLLLVPIICILLFITIIGVPLALITLCIYIIAIYISKIFVGLYLGKKTLVYFTKKQEIPPVQSLILGLIIILTVINIPFIGGIINFIIILLGLGVLGIVQKELFRRKKEINP